MASELGDLPERQEMLSGGAEIHKVLRCNYRRFMLAFKKLVDGDVIRDGNEKKLF